MTTHFSKKDLIPYALLVAFCMFLFKDIVIGGHRLFGTDFIAFYLGMKNFLYDEILTHHSIPFWNPYIFGGMPFWAHFESTIFYPLGFLFWIISPDRAYGYTMFMHLLLAGAFMYTLSRSFHISRAGSFVAASVFVCNGFVVAILYLGQMCPVQSYIWLPLIIYFLNQAASSQKPYLSAAVAGLLWGIQILAGAPQDAFYTFLASLLFLLYSINRDVKAHRNGINLLIVASLLFVIGVGVAGIQLVPAFELMGQSVRAGMDSYEMVTSASYPPEGIVTTVMPHFFGSYTKGNCWVSDIPWSIPQQNLYVGILPIILLFFMSYRGSHNRRVMAFAASLAVIAFVLSLGGHTPVYKLVYLLPGFDKFRAPSKIIVLWVFAFGLLAGKGMDDLFRHSKASLSWRAGLSLCAVVSLVLLDALFHLDRSIVTNFFAPFILDAAIPNKMVEAADIICGEFHRLTLFSAFLLLTILLWIRGALSPRLSAVFLCAFVLFDLGYTNRGAFRHNDEAYHSMAQTKQDLDMSIGKDRELYRVGSYVSNLGPNIEMYLGYQTVGGFTALFLHRYYEYINQYFEGLLPEGWAYFFYGRHKKAILMDLLNLKYEISYATREYTVRKTYLPRTFIVPTCKSFRKEEILDYLIKPEFAPTQVVLLEEGVNLYNLSEHSSHESRKPGLAKIVSYLPDHIVVSTSSSTPGYLFLSEMFYPGWKAFVDDQPKRILRGNYLFRVVQLPEGQHVVRFVFDPLSIKVGISITIMTLFVIIGVLVYHVGRRISLLNRHRT